MRINELALAMMLLAGATGVSSAKAAELSMTDSDSTTDTAVESAQPESPAPDASVVSHDSESQPQASQEAAVIAAPSESAQEPAVSAPVQPEQSPPEAEHPLSAINQTTRASAEPDPAVITQPTSEADAAQKSAPAKDTQPLFTPEQEARIGELAKAYLLNHPELLIEVDQILQKKQYDEQIKAMTQAVLQHQDALLKDDNIPSIGPAEVKVALIEFFDYQCNISSHQAPVIRALMKNHPEVRFVFREWPIFGYCWKPSFQAAETGLKIWQQKGADAYIKFHDALFNTGHV